MRLARLLDDDDFADRDTAIFAQPRNVCTANERQPIYGIRASGWPLRDRGHLLTLR